MEPDCDLIRHEGDISVTFVGGEKPCRIEGELLHPQDVLIWLGKDTNTQMKCDGAI